MPGNSLHPLDPGCPVSSDLFSLASPPVVVLGEEAVNNAREIASSPVRVPQIRMRLWEFAFSSDTVFSFAMCFAQGLIDYSDRGHLLLSVDTYASAT
jgi:hypothetical protein